MKLAILGGSFNPVHIGHLFLADAVLTELGYDRVILVPAYQSPFKIGAEGASPADRVEMLAASITGDPRLCIDDCEIRREGVSYTIDTLNDIISRYMPEGKPALILGDDLASAFYKWRKPGEIAELSDIIIAKRLREPALSAEQQSCDSSPQAGILPGQNSCNGDTRLSEPGFFPYPYKALNNEIMEVSSRFIREKISRNENWRYLVPSGARYIIEDRGLYGFSALEYGENKTGEKNSSETPVSVVKTWLGKTFPLPVASSPVKAETGLKELTVRIENDVRGILSFNRFVHSRNTALLSWDLCIRFGLDPQRGYLAGIAHDICKSSGEKELIRLAYADGGSISKLEKTKPGLLHGRAAAALLKKKYGITDKDILEAVRSHTTGARDMGPLAKVVYVADKIEISRTGIDPAIRKMSEGPDLDTIFLTVLNDTVAYLRSHELDISYGTRRLLAAMQKRNDP